VEHSPGPSICQLVCLLVHIVYCGKTADWIWMPCGMVNGFGRGIGVLDGGGDRRRRRGSFWVISGRPIVTNWAFVA